MINRIAQGSTRSMLLGVLLLSSASLWADDRICRGAMAQVNIQGNLVVPAGSYCLLSQSRIQGNIQVEAQASVHLQQVQLSGHLLAKKAQQIEIQRSHIAGNVEAKAYRAVLQLSDSQVNGHLHCDKGTLANHNSRIRGNIHCARGQS